MPRRYTAADYAILQILVSKSDDPLGPPLWAFQNEFVKHGLEWPVLNPPSLEPTEYASFVDREICRACGR